MQSEIIMNQIESLDEVERHEVLDSLYERYFTKSESIELEKLSHRLASLIEIVEKNSHSIEIIQEQMILSVLNKPSGEKRGQPSENQQTFENVKMAWTLIVAILEEKLSTASFETWIEPIDHEKVTLENDRLTLPCQSEFQRDWIASQYCGLIQELAVQIVGRAIEVRAVCRAEDSVWF